MATPWPAWQAPIVLVSCGAGIAGAWQWARGAFLPGAILLLVSIALLRWPRSIWTPTLRSDLPERTQRVGLLLVCALAVFFRLYRVEPPGLWGDDAINGLLALDVLDGTIRSPLKLVDHSFSTFHALTNYLIAGAFLLLGIEPYAIRVPGVLLNLLSVPLLYGIVSPLFGPRAALLAALFFASSPFELGHAKGLLQNGVGQSLEIAGLCLLVQGGLRRRRWLLVAAGAPLAFALCTYHSAKLVPLIAAVVLWQAMRCARARRISLAWPVLGGTSLFLLCAIPVALGYIKHPAALTDRLSGTSLWATILATQNLWPLWDSVWRTLAVFHYQQGPIYHWFGIGTDPGMNAVLGCFIVHGVAQSLRRWRHPAHAALLGWFLIGLIPGVLSSEAPRGYRILIATPPVYTWAALPLARLLSHCSDSWTWRAVRAVVLGLVLAVPLLDFNYYFYRVYTSGIFRWYQCEPMVEMARELRSYGPQWVGYLVADNFTAEYETMRFLKRAWNLQVRDVANLGDVLPVRDLTGAGALFMLMRTPFESVALLRSMYPALAPDVRYEPRPRTGWWDAVFDANAPPSSTPMTVAFFPVSRDMAARIGGLEAAFVADDGKLIARRIDTRPLVEGPADLPMVPPGAPQPARLVWHGSLLAPVDGTYGFRLESTDEALVSLGPLVIATHDEPSSLQSLPQGLHTLTIVARVGVPPWLRLFWQPPGESERLIEPGRLFHRPARGLRAEYETHDGLRRRIEPYPYHLVFPVPFPGTYSARWSGWLTVPAPGGYRLSVESDRAVTIEVDQRVVTVDDSLSQGRRALAIHIAQIEGAPRLRLYWQVGDRPRELIPPEAFTPG
jgi:hypothetical protein